MEAIAALSGESEVSALTLQRAAGAQLHPEPEWIARAADELGWEWARANWQRAACVPGAWFDAAKADHIVALWPKVFRLTTKRFAGKRFMLSFWQELIVRLFVGWKYPIEVTDEDAGVPTTIYVRVFQELRLWIPRKNGKSEFLAALAILFWALEGEVRGQGFCFAHDENQAREVFDKMSDMVGYAPSLSVDVKVLSKALWIQRLKSPFKLLPGKALGKHGKAPSVTVGDEMHEWRSRDLANTLRQGEGTSLQPVRLYASTAGLKTQIVGKELFDESVSILDGRIDDPSVLVAIFALEEDEDWSDERNWGKVNPSLGLSPTLMFLRAERAKANNPTGEAAFRRYHLNQWVEDFTRWLPIRKWDACAADKNAWKTFPQQLAGRDCHLAFDSTKSFDFATICLRFPPVEEGEKTKFIWRFWLPSETIAQRVKAEKVPFDRWEREGALTPIPGGVFVLGHAIAAAKEALQAYNVLQIGWDSWNALEFYNRLVDGGVSEDLFVEMRFGARSLGAASKEFERKVFAGELDHGGHPVARWMAAHCHVRFDENMNFVPAKKRSNQSIDGIVAGVMCEALGMEIDTGKSFWETAVLAPQGAA